MSVAPSVAPSVAQPRVTPRFPTPLTLDPWWDVFFPARMGERAHAEAAIDELLAAAPDGDTLAICARALFTTGEGFRAERLAIRALHAGGHEAERLAVVHRVDGRDRVAGVLSRTRRPGIRAEVWCDLASRCLLEGDVPAARAAIDAAAQTLPDHLETRRWQRFLQEAVQPQACFQQATRRAPPVDAAALRDAFALVGHRKNGFMAAERWDRRHQVDATFAPRGSAWERLCEAGLGRALIFPERELAGLPAADPAAVLELLVSETRSLVSEGRTAAASVRAVLGEVRRFDPQVQAAGVRACAELAMLDPVLVPQVLDAVERLLPHDPAAWMGWVALLGWDARPDRSTRYARTLLADPGTRPDAFLLAHQALCRCGHIEEARRYAERAATLPGLRGAARSALATGLEAAL